jgi:hypothetical protein
MKNMRPEKLAIRTINQYRNRDIIAYLSLRYYLENFAAKSDNWIREVSTDLVLTNIYPTYHKSSHYKEVTADGEIKYRDIYLPIANEALAEAALLDECSKYPEFESLSECVFSYSLANDESKSGIFTRYIDGLRKRQQAISTACEIYPNGIVAFTDIKSFYPSITIDLALSVWDRKCSSSALSNKFRLLGRKIISGYATIEKNANPTIPVGPALSHFIGNLVLQDLDIFFQENLPVKYFRYVDDITLVGNVSEVKLSLATVREKLEYIGLKLHDEDSAKNIQGSTSEWLRYKSDFIESHRHISWKTLVGDLRRFILINPDMRIHLEKAFIAENFRIPVFEYVTTKSDSNFVKRFIETLSNKFLRAKSVTITIGSILNQCRYLRDIYFKEISDLIESLQPEHNFDRKSKIPKIRYRAGRLMYLAPDSILEVLSKKLQEIPETVPHAVVMDCIATKNIDKILSFGPNCTQMAAQPLRACDSTVFTTLKELTPIQEQALIVLKLYSIKIVDEPNLSSELGRFSSLGSDLSLMKSKNLYIKDLACLHGIFPYARHAKILSTYLDEDEELVFDAIDQLHISS